MNNILDISKRKYQLEQTIANHTASSTSYAMSGETREYWAIYNSLKQDLADVTDELLSVTKRK